MKKAIYLLTGLFLLLFPAAAQQDSLLKKHSNSLTISVAPAFFATMDEKLESETFWPASIYVTKNFMLKKRLSFSTGIHFLFKRFNETGSAISDAFPGYSGPTNTTNKYTIIDIPLRLNYQIVKPNDRVNLYIKAEIRNSFIANYTKKNPDIFGEYGSHTDFGYCMFLGFGAGADFRITDRFSAVIEPGVNYAIFGMLPDVGIIDFQVGIKYNLINSSARLNLKQK